MQSDPDAEQVRRRLQELAEDLRVTITGAQVLFGFLLTLPFTNRFALVASGNEKTDYFIAFVTAAASATFLIAPSALHRLYHVLGDPRGLPSLLRIAGRLAVAGTVLLAVSMATVVYLITEILYRSGAASVVTAALIGLTAWVWFALPIVYSLRERDGSPSRRGQKQA